MVFQLMGFRVARGENIVELVGVGLGFGQGLVIHKLGKL